MCSRLSCPMEHMRKRKRNMCNLEIYDPDRTRWVELLADPFSKSKSFHRKAMLGIAPDDITFLRSYNTIVASVRNGVLEKHWDGYSDTTMRHVDAFVRRYNPKNGGQGPAWWKAMKLSLPRRTA